MNKKTTILCALIVVAAVIATIAVGVFKPGEKPAAESKVSDTATSNNHDETNSNKHHDDDDTTNAPIEDLTNQSVVSMDIKDFAYSKPNIKIKKGTTVTWTNQDTVKHNVMLEHDGGGAAHDAPSPGEVKPDVFAGPLLAKGESYSFTFNEAGADPYHCSPHPDMKGTITVVE